MSSLSHLKRLSTVRSGKNIKFLTPAVYSGGWCPMPIACNVAEGVDDLSYLLVCMPECATYSRGMTTRPEGERGELRRTYVLDANEVIFGCREGVCDALRQMDAEGAKAILMVATCVTDLIGEDFEGIINEMQPQLKARLAYVKLGQFKNFGTPMGTARTAEAMALLMEPRETKPGTANVLFIEPWRSQNTPTEYPLIIHALERRGVPIRRITADADLASYLAAPEAEVNLVISSYMQPLAEKMNAMFGTQFVDLHNAFSVSEIDAAYARIEQLFGVSLAGEFDGWRRKAIELEERARKELAGVKYVMLTEVDMPVRLALYLAGFGMEPLLLHVSDMLDEDIRHAKTLKALGVDPPICRLMHDEHDIRIIRDMEPDICFGYLRNPVEGIKCAEEMNDFFGITGYERTVGILERIFTVLETGITPRGFDIYGPQPL